ncbi:histidine phosphatase family protein [Microdochium nivale]|nr:histidine phosphatase family protein [Microdochium nivale]
MAPIIHLVRHAQGYHNVRLENEKLRDPDLTPLGKDQCAKLRESFPDHDKITQLVASPMRRTLYTCLYSFAPVVEAGRPGSKVIALPEAQEVSLSDCDMGTDVDKLKAEFGDKVDFSSVPAGWNDKSPESKYYPTPEKLAARSREARLWLRDLADKLGQDAQIVLVAHGGILHFLTEEWDDIEPGRGTGWVNTEIRSYQFADASGQDPNASLRETQPSWGRRRGSQVPLTAAEQAQRLEAFSNEMNAHTSLLEKKRQSAASP